MTNLSKFFENAFDQFETNSLDKELVVLTNSYDSDSRLKVTNFTNKVMSFNDFVTFYEQENSCIVTFSMKCKMKFEFASGVHVILPSISLKGRIKLEKIDDSTFKVKSLSNPLWIGENDAEINVDDADEEMTSALPFDETTFCDYVADHLELQLAEINTVFKI